MGMIEINMKMPEKCGLCPCFHYENPMYCQAVKADKNKKIVNPYGSQRPEWCPLKEQEPVKPKKVKGYFPPMYTHYKYECEKCETLIIEKQPFCMGCGRPVKWE